MSVRDSSEVRSKFVKVTMVINLALVIIAIILIVMGGIFITAVNQPSQQQLAIILFVCGGILLLVAGLGYFIHLRSIKNYEQI